MPSRTNPEKKYGLPFLLTSRFSTRFLDIMRSDTGQTMLLSLFVPCLAGHVAVCG